MVRLPLNGYVYREIRDPMDGQEINRVPGMTDITIGHTVGSTKGGIVLSWFEPKNKKIKALYVLFVTLEACLFWISISLLIVFFWLMGAQAVWGFLLLRGVI